MNMFLRFVPLALICNFAFANTYLTPLDFGLSLRDHGMVDYVHTPPNILVANFSSDSYPDIARFDGNTLDIFIFQGLGYTQEPQSSRTFDQPIKSMRLDGFVWDNLDNLVVTLENGDEDTLYNRGGCLDLSGYEGPFKRSDIPRRVSEADFEIVWESEPRPLGMDKCAVGDLDNDGIIELVTWWKESMYADSAWILIYKSIGNDEYELFMEEPFFIIEAAPYLTNLLISDLDQNGQKELIYTCMYAYFWEFSEPGVYWPWRSSFTFYAGVADIKVTDVDQDGILELASLSNAWSWQPPCAYQIMEYYHKSSWPYYNYSFLTITGLFQDWIDSQFDIGDFDNDGAVDMVSGNFGMVWGYDPVDVQFFRYDSTNTYNFTQHWLYTGIPLSCSTPVIADFDEDGEKELFAGGVFTNGGSAFVWEATGLGSGYVSWLDTTSMFFGPNESSVGIIDFNPAVISQVIYTITYTSTQLFLFGWEGSQFSYLWSSSAIDSCPCHNPIFFDIDFDSKMNIVMAANGLHKVMDWEQVSAGVWENPQHSIPESFQLHPNYPNPFNSSTVIPFEISKTSDIRLSVYDIFGRIAYEYNEEDLLPGHYATDWDASGLSSGIYFIKLQVRDEQQVRKGVLMK